MRDMMHRADYVAGFLECGSRILNFLNTLENKTVTKSEIYRFIMGLRV